MLTGAGAKPWRHGRGAATGQRSAFGRPLRCLRCSIPLSFGVRCGACGERGSATRERTRPAPSRPPASSPLARPSGGGGLLCGPCKGSLQKAFRGSPPDLPPVTPFALASDKWPLIRHGPPGSPPLALRVAIRRALCPHHSLRSGTWPGENLQPFAGRRSPASGGVVALCGVVAAVRVLPSFAKEAAHRGISRSPPIPP